MVPPQHCAATEGTHDRKREGKEAKPGQRHAAGRTIASRGVPCLEEECRQAEARRRGARDEAAGRAWRGEGSGGARRIGRRRYDAP
jgi:hypothetical protein